MQTEEQCPPDRRFLFSDTWFSDNAVSIWQAECIDRRKNIEKGVAYEKYIDWKRQENEIPVFTLYAYADVAIPKHYDIIFRLDDPGDFIKVDYELVQGIHEAWFPVDQIGQGHKHLCIFRFAKTIPAMLGLLHQETKKISTVAPEQKKLGFCHSKDFPDITRGISGISKLHDT